jgi:hypothetical protein
MAPTGDSQSRKQFDVTQTRVVVVGADPAAVRDAAAAVDGRSRDALDAIVASVVGSAGEVAVDWDVQPKATEEGSFVSVRLGFSARNERSRRAMLDGWRTIGPAAVQAAAQALRAIKACAEDEQWQPRRATLAVAA